MPVEDVNAPRKILNIDPKSTAPKIVDDSADYWEKQAKSARAKREYIAEQKAIESISTQPMAESPFQVKGSVNLGNIDIMEQIRSTNEAAARAKAQADTEKAQLVEKLAETERKLNETILSGALRDISQKVDDRLNAISQQINNSNGNSKGINPILEQLDVLDTLASKLGYQRNDGASQGVNAAVAQTGESMRLKIELARLDAESKARDRAYELEMKKFEYQMLQDAEERKRAYEIKQEELKHKAEQEKMFAGLPQIIGQGIAAGFKQAPDPAPNPGTNFINKNAQPNNTRISSQPQVKQQEQPQYIECDEGEEGQLPCPKCGAPIVIAADTKTAICGHCGNQMRIDRLPANNAKPQPKNPEFATDADDREQEDE